MKFRQKKHLYKSFLKHKHIKQIFTVGNVYKYVRN